MVNRPADDSGSHHSRSKPSRRFTVLDEMILVVLFAAGIVVTGAFWESDLRQFTSFRPAQLWGWEVLDWAPFFLLGLFPRYIALAMPALFVMRLRRPRPSLRKLSRQPGCVACAAGSAALLAGGLLVLSWTLFREDPRMRLEAPSWPAVESYVAAAVLAAWAALLLGGRWRSEPTWIDRAGRVCGTYWVFVTLYRWVLMVYLPT